MGWQAVRNEGTAGNMDGRQAMSGWGMLAVLDGLGIIGMVSNVCVKAWAHHLACGCILWAWGHVTGPGTEPG